MPGMWLCEGWIAFEGLLLYVALGRKPWFLIRWVMLWGYPGVSAFFTCSEKFVRE